MIYSVVDKRCDKNKIVFVHELYDYDTVIEMGMHRVNLSGSFY